MPCPACPGKNLCVSPSGPECNDYGVVFIGEAPGRDEKTEPFQGKTGREVNQGYMPLAGIRRDRVRVTNAIRCLPDTPQNKLDLKKQAHKDLLRSCAEWHLYPELERIKPKLIVPMGAFACYAIDPDISLELQHGMPVQTQWGMCFPMYHPAGGIHEPKKMLQIRTDWVRLRKYLNGSLSLPVDRYTNPDYRECQTPYELDAYLADLYNQPMACDTETVKGGSPFCLTLSINPGTGRLIRSTQLAVLSRFQHHLDTWAGPILFHNWLFDGTVVEAMGLNFPRKRIVDTMVKVFHLGNLPQGLKALAYRELGMTMQDFDDLVTPYSRPIVLDYYTNARTVEWSTPEPQLVRTDVGGWKMYKPQGFSTKLKRFWTDYSKDQDKDVFEMWNKAWAQCPICKETDKPHTCIDIHSEVQKELGPWPGKCITHAPFDRVLRYACRDADSTLRLWPVIQHMESRVRTTSQEYWGEGYAA